MDEDDEDEEEEDDDEEEDEDEDEEGTSNKELTLAALTPSKLFSLLLRWWWFRWWWWWKWLRWFSRFKCPPPPPLDDVIVVSVELWASIDVVIWCVDAPDMWWRLEESASPQLPPTPRSPILAPPLPAGTRFGDFGLPLLFSVYLLTSGLIIHQELFPELSFCTRMKRLCNDRLWRIEFLIRIRKSH